MSRQRDLFHIVAFDPGGITGWAHLIIHMDAFRSPKERVLKHLKYWKCGEYNGTEFEQAEAALKRCREARFGLMPFNSEVDIVGEDFHLTQIKGGKALLSPVRVLARIDHIVERDLHIQVQYQNRELRTNVTKERLQRMGIWPVRGKDAFAAMQHAVTWAKRRKRWADRKDRLPTTLATGRMLA